MNWTKIWNDIVNFFETNVWNIVIFFAVLFGGIIIIKILISIFKKILYKTKAEKIAVGFFAVVLKVALYLILVLALMSIIGINITGALTALSALLLAIGLALQNIIANAANGLVIVSNRMFKKGDYVSVDGLEGNVSNINFLFTTIITADNKRVTVPNSAIVNGSVIDYDSVGTRRVDLKFSVAYESDVEKVKRVILDCIKRNKNVKENPEPFCRLNALNSSSIEFIVKCWCDSPLYWTVYHDVLESVYNELKRNKISIPYDQIEIRERKDRVVLPVTKSLSSKSQDKTQESRKKESEQKKKSATKIVEQSKNKGKVIKK